MAIHIQSNAPKPYTVLTKVRSESGAWEYEIRTSHKTGVTYCTCKGWQTHQHCKHLDAYNANPVIAVSSPANMPVRPKTKTPGEVLREELAALGHNISIASATAISTRVLSAGGKAAPAGTGWADELNTENVRVIVLPD